MPDERHYKGKTAEELLACLADAGDPTGSIASHQVRMAIIVRCTDALSEKIQHLTQAINNASAGSDRLGKQLIWLNILLAAATIVGGIGAFGAFLVALR